MKRSARTSSFICLCLKSVFNLNDGWIPTFYQRQNGKTKKRSKEKSWGEWDKWILSLFFFFSYSYMFFLSIVSFICKSPSTATAVAASTFNRESFFLIWIYQIKSLVPISVFVLPNMQHAREQWVPSLIPREFGFQWKTGAFRQPSCRIKITQSAQQWVQT